MITIEVSIGKEGFAWPVTFARLVRSHLHVDLAAAKKVLDSLAENRAVVLRFDDRPDAEAFCNDVESIGLVVREL